MKERPSYRPVWLIACLAVLALSLTGRPGVTGPVPSLSFIAGGVLGLLSALGLWRGGVRGNPLPLVSCMALALLGVMSLSQSPAPYLTLMSLASLSGFVGVFLACYLGPTERHHWRVCAVGMIAVAFVSAAFGLYQYALYDGATALKANFTNPDCYSVIPLLAFFLCVGMALEGKKWAHVIFGLGALVFLVTVVLTATRAGALALLVGYGGFLFTLSSSRSPRWRSLSIKLLIAPLVIILLLVSAGGDLALGQKWGRLTEVTEQANMKSRLDVALYSYKTIARSPWLGHGLGCFHLAYQQDRPGLAPGEDYMNVAHNDYVQWTVETGIAGGAAWIVLLFSSLRAAWLGYRSPTPWVAGQVASILGISTYCAFNFACPVTADFYWIAACLGLSCSLPSLESRASQPWNPKIFPLALLLGLWGGWTAWFGWNCSRVQSLELTAKLQERDLDWESAILSMQAASKGVPQDPGPALREAGLCHRAFVFSGKPHWLEMEESALLRANRASRRDLKILLTTAKFYEETQRNDQAKIFLDQAAQFAPYSPHVRRLLVRNLILTGKPREAAANLASIEATGITIDEQTLALLIGWMECEQKGQGLPYLLGVSQERVRKLGLEAAQVARERKNYPAASRLLAEVSRIHPNDPAVLFEIALNLGLDGQAAAELKALEQLRKNPGLESDPITSEKVWQRWCELQMANKHEDLVSSQLVDYLITHPRQMWARYKLAGIAISNHKDSDARAALQEGLPYDDDGSLRLKLADMCAGQGLKALAASYYREALKLSPNRALVESRLRTVKTDDELEMDNSE